MRPIHRHPFVEELLPLRDEAVRRHHAKHAPTKHAPAKPPCQSLAHYQAQALSRIGGVHQDIRQRNEKISGAYAALWMKNHDAFRWQGAAAHASGQVGLVMDLCDPRLQKRVADAIPDQVFDPTAPVMPPLPPVGPFAPDGPLGPHPVGRMNKVLALEAVMPLDNAMRQALADGNIAIYESIYPVSLAYAHGGMAELNCISGTLSGEAKRKFDKERKAFADIDQGIALKQAGDKTGGEQLIRYGNTELIHFEQDNVAQPVVFDKHPNLTWAMTPFAFGHFSGDPYHPDLATLSTYYPSHAPHSLGDMPQRDDWIINDIFPVWYQQYEQDPALTTQRMQMILDRGRAAGGSY